MKTWSLMDAQDHLEEVVQSALEHKPQRVVRDFREGAVVVLSADDYARLTRNDDPNA